MDAIRQLFLKPWIYLLIVLLGTFFKLDHINTKLFWRDEISTVLYTSGVKEVIVRDQIPVNTIRSIGYYDSLLHHNHETQTLKSEITGILSDTHLTPGHYVFLTIWHRLVGDKDMDYRLFSVFIYILSLPFLFVLLKTLFHSGLAGWIGMSLYAVSPFIDFEAQEARYYILWVFTFLLSNYLFLQATRQNKPRWWLAYAAAAMLALYTSALSGVFILGHLAYMLLFRKKQWLQFAFYLSLVLLAYLPWMYFLYRVSEKIQSGLAWQIFDYTSVYTLKLVWFQLLGLVRSFAYFFDSKLYLMMFMGGLSSEHFAALFTDSILLAFIFYAFYYLFTSTPRETSWFLICLILPLFLLIYISDVIRHGIASLLWRYHIVNMVAISLVVTNLLEDKIAKGKLVFIGAYAGLTILGITSIMHMDEKRCWNTSPDCDSNVENARLISNAAHPLVITDFNHSEFTNLLVLINAVKGNNMDILYCKESIPDIKEKVKAKGYSDIFVVDASDTLVQHLKAQFGGNFALYSKEAGRWNRPIWRIRT
jgi:uncharacterized membrane protein